MTPAANVRYLLVTLCIMAMTTLVPAGDAGDGAPFSDAAFLRKAAVASMAEVHLGHIALQKSDNPAIQQFATRMVHDHQAHGQQVRRVAAGVQVAVPARLDSKFSVVIQKFAALEGPQFEAEYTVATVSNHQQTVQQFRRASVEAHNASVRAFAAASLPMLEEHLRLATTLLQQMQMGSRGGQGVMTHRYPAKPATCPTYY